MSNNKPEHFTTWLQAIATRPIAKRLINGSFANFLGKVWVLIIQLISIPVLTQKWGIEGYGLWLMISTIPTYIALSDLGLGSAAGIEITKKVDNSDYYGALEIFQTAWIALSTLVSMVALFVVVYAGFLYNSQGESIARFTPQDIAIAIIIITVYSWVAVQMSILNVVFKATHKYAFGTFLLDSLLPIEGAALIIIVFLGGGLVEVAFAMLVLRLIGWLIFRLILLKKEPWLRLSYNKASWSKLQSLLSPSLAIITLTLSNALMLQGVILAIGWVMGPAIVAIYGAARMLTRIPLQFSSLVWRASIPELTRSQNSNNVTLTRKLLSVNVIFSLLVTTPPLLALILFGPQLLEYISVGKLKAPTVLFIFLALAAFSNALWNATASFLIANNRQKKFSYLYLLLCGLTVITPMMIPSIIALAVVAAISETIILIRVALLHQFSRGG